MVCGLAIVVLSVLALGEWLLVWWYLESRGGSGDGIMSRGGRGRSLDLQSRAGCNSTAIQQNT